MEFENKRLNQEARMTAAIASKGISKIVREHEERDRVMFDSAYVLVQEARLTGELERDGDGAIYRRILDDHPELTVQSVTLALDAVSKEPEDQIANSTAQPQ